MFVKLSSTNKNNKKKKTYAIIKTADDPLALCFFLALKFVISLEILFPLLFIVKQFRPAARD